MSTDEEWMRIAIEEARKSAEPLPCGAVIVKDGQILAQAHNTQHSSHNATAHAEITAIATAGQKIGNKNLSECTIYCTCEPCTMCLSAIIFAKIKRLVYGVSLATVSPENKRIDISIDDFLVHAPYRPETTPNLLVSECHKAPYMGINH